MSNDNIKLEFENQIHAIEEKDNNNNKIFMNIMNIAFVILFIAVSIGTVLSYYNYKEVVNKAKNSDIPVIEFGK